MAENLSETARLWYCWAASSSFHEQSSGGGRARQAMPRRSFLAVSCDRAVAGRAGVCGRRRRRRGGMLASQQQQQQSPALTLSLLLLIRNARASAP